jgi:hypothetical protein
VKNGIGLGHAAAAGRHQRPVSGHPIVSIASSMAVRLVTVSPTVSQQTMNAVALDLEVFLMKQSFVVIGLRWSEVLATDTS